MTTWLWGDLLESATIDALYGRLLADLASEGDANGFLQPFAALVLSEVARTDRVGNTFTPEHMPLPLPHHLKAGMTRTRARPGSHAGTTPWDF